MNREEIKNRIDQNEADQRKLGEERQKLEGELKKLNVPEMRHGDIVFVEGVPYVWLQDQSKQFIMCTPVDLHVDRSEIDRRKYLEDDSRNIKGNIFNLIRKANL